MGACGNVRDGMTKDGKGRGGIAVLCLACAVVLGGPLAAQQPSPPRPPSQEQPPQEQSAQGQSAQGQSARGQSARGQSARDGSVPDPVRPGLSPTDLPATDLPATDLPAPLSRAQGGASGGVSGDVGAGGLPDLSSGTIPLSDPQAVSSPILTMDQDVLYLSSAWGLRAQARLEAEGDTVTAENDRLTQLLSREEAALTEQRATLPAAEFRRMAESFDLRATRIRRERAQAVQDLNAWAEADRAAFFRAALPVMGRIMQERGAVAVLDRRTVFVSLEAIDVTQQLVEALDRRVGDGEGVVPLPDPPPPAPEDAPPAP